MKQRELFIQTIKAALEEHPNTILLLGDISTFAFKDSPRVINCGCGEQAMVGIAAGLALEGWYPIVHSIAPFLLRRAYEQIKIDFLAQRLNGMFIGLNYYQGLGDTHICPEWQELCYAMHLAYAPITWFSDFKESFKECMEAACPIYIDVDANL